MALRPARLKTLMRVSSGLVKARKLKRIKEFEYGS
ncbi:MAG: hypothetical protein QOG58_2203 [Caballeronia sp.]|jgi:hypothetical protein|nr:hypothetical protein [Caballeronia sp.]